jgi:hypothetical protein
MEKPNLLILGAEENPIRDPLIFADKFMQRFITPQGLN